MCLASEIGLKTQEPNNAKVENPKSSSWQDSASATCWNNKHVQKRQHKGLTILIKWIQQINRGEFSKLKYTSSMMTKSSIYHN